MPKILIADTYYSDFLKSLHFNPAANYASELKFTLAQCFGTGDFYSRNLAALGWEARDVIANHYQLQQLWAQENPGWYNGDRLEAQIAVFDPDVIFSQDLNLPIHKSDRLLAGQCSCPMPPEDKVRQYDVIFTSFPHYVERFERMGIKTVFNPLAFDPIVLDRMGPQQTERNYDAVFIGGVGNPSHWRNGMETLEAVAHAIPTFKWWGYGYETLPRDSALRECYEGEAWGLDYYRILLQSKIVLNRHGEVAQGMTNNMRCFEATGCGALLLTERSLNLGDFFRHDEVAAYGSPDEAIYHIQALLNKPEERQFMASNGQRRTLKDHTYAKLMAKVSEVLTGMLCTVNQS